MHRHEEFVRKRRTEERRELRVRASRAPSSESIPVRKQHVDQQEPTVSLTMQLSAAAVYDYKANKDLLAIQGLAVQ
jgi:hypothetical protein